MTGALWVLVGVVGVAFILCAFGVGLVVGGRIAYRQLKADTGGWQHPPPT